MPLLKKVAKEISRGAHQAEREIKRGAKKVEAAASRCATHDDRAEAKTILDLASQKHTTLTSQTATIAPRVEAIEQRLAQLLQQRAEIANDPLYIAITTILAGINRAVIVMRAAMERANTDFATITRLCGQIQARPNTPEGEVHDDCRCWLEESKTVAANFNIAQGEAMAEVTQITQQFAAIEAIWSQLPVALAVVPGLQQHLQAQAAVAEEAQGSQPIVALQANIALQP